MSCGKTYCGSSQSYLECVELSRRFFKYSYTKISLDKESSYKGVKNVDTFVTSENVFDPIYEHLCSAFYCVIYSIKTKAFSY